MRGSSRLGRLLLTVAVAVLACVPQRAGSEDVSLPVRAAGDAIDVTLGAIGLDPVVTKRHATGEIATVDSAPSLLPGALVAVLTAALLAFVHRRWAAVLVEAARHGVVAAVALARLRAPPIAR